MEFLCRIGKRRNERIDKKAAFRFIPDEREHLLELVGNEENTFAGVRRATLSNDINKRNFAVGQTVGELLGSRHSIYDVSVSEHRRKGTSQRGERVLVGFGSNTEIA